MDETQNTPNERPDDAADEQASAEFDAAALPASELELEPVTDALADDVTDSIDDATEDDLDDSAYDVDEDALDDDADDEEYDDEQDVLEPEDEGLEMLSVDDGMDVDAALAALGSLDVVMSEQAEMERAEADRLEAERRTEDEYQRWVASYQFARPGMIRAQTGRPATIAPALGLMTLGALLTLGTTSGGITSGLLAIAVSAALGLALVSYWLTAHRWARGALFAGLTALGIAGIIALQTYTTITLPWSAPLIVFGLALLLTGWLARPRSGTLAAIGLATAGASALVGLVALPDVLTQVAPFILAGAAVLLVLPLLLRRGARA